MKPYIYGARNGIYIIDLQQTVKLFKEAYDYVRATSAKGGTVLFVGTKKQAQSAIADEAKRAGCGYIANRWIGGFLTNFATVKKSIDRLKELDNIKANPSNVVVTKKEALMLERERARLDKYLGGVRDLAKPPAIIFIIDSRKETIAIKEAKRLGIKVVAIVDTNCDPDMVDIVIPGNDDAIRAIKLFSSSVADAVLEGKAAHAEALQAASDKKAAAAAVPAPVVAAAVVAAPVAATVAAPQAAPVPTKQA